MERDFFIESMKRNSGCLSVAESVEEAYGVVNFNNVFTYLNTAGLRPRGINPYRFAAMVVQMHRQTSEDGIEL